jgi:hypothetical protein
MAQQEAECAAGLENPAWFRTIMPAEHHDSERSGLFPCSQFPGSFTEPNSVYAYPSSDVYYNPFNMATRGVDEMYVYGGASGDAAPPGLQPYVSRVELGTLHQQWRTYLNNVNLTKDFSLAGAVDILADGSIGSTAGHKLYKINATTGAIEAVITLPTGVNPPKDSGFNSFSAFSDGTLVLKSFNRPVGCTVNGYSAAAYKCPGAPGSANPSVLSVVDPKTWKVLDWVQSSENSAGRISATEFQGNNYAYFAGTSSVFRYVWDGKNITLDETWGPVSYLLPGQTSASACGIMGDWVICMTNGGQPSKVPLSIFAISQANASKITRIEPMSLKPGQVSYIPSMPSFDRQNNRIYAMDPGPGRSVGINLDQKTGNMTLAWSSDQTTLSWMILIGPANQRVLVGTNIASNVTNPLDLQSGPKGVNYKEQIQWRDADTGKLLAASDYFSPMSAGFEVWPGYGGLIYEGLNDGHLMALKVLPTSSPTPSPPPSNSASTNSTSTTSAAGG